MFIPNKFRKCVAFIGYRMADGTYRVAGTGFFVGLSVPGTQLIDPVYLVTAKHLIKAIADLGLTHVSVRANRESGDSVWNETECTAWFLHPDTACDVAILRVGIPAGFDHYAISYEWFFSDSELNQLDGCLGEEVAVVGLFRHHHGTRQSIPIVRVGNLAATGEEKVTTSIGDMNAFLIEARSLGGLSGSPVFINFGQTRVVEGKLRVNASGPMVFLLGLVHGHFDVVASAVDAGAPNISIERVNTGIAIVVPTRTIRETISLFEKAAEAAR